MIDVMFAMVMEQLVHYRKEVIMAHMKEEEVRLKYFFFWELV